MVSIYFNEFCNIVILCRLIKIGKKSVLVPAIKMFWHFNDLVFLTVIFEK